MSTTLRTYYRGADQVGMRDGLSGQTRYYHYDHEGTTQCLTDSAGAVTDRFASDAWGVPVKRTGTSINRQWYVGKLGYSFQSAAKAYYVRARYLQPSIGRWESRDSDPDQGHAYAYVSNSPVTQIDPTGHAALDGLLAVLGVAGGIYWWLRRGGCCELNKAEHAYLESNCQACKRRFAPLHLGRFWNHACKVAETAIKCDTRVLGEAAYARSEYGLSGIGQKLLLPKRFLKQWPTYWATDHDPCRLLFHESIHLHCGIARTNGDHDDPNLVGQGTGGSVYVWAAFAETVVNECSPQSQEVFASWHRGNPQRWLCDAVADNKKPEDVFTFAPRKRFSPPSPCPTGLK